MAASKAYRIPGTGIVTSTTTVTTLILNLLSHKGAPKGYLKKKKNPKAKKEKNPSIYKENRKKKKQNPNTQASRKKRQITDNNKA